MVYLVIRNLGVDRCIDQREEDRYVDGESYKCTLNIPFVPGKFLREIEIVCLEQPGTRIRARIFMDEK